MYTRHDVLKELTQRLQGRYADLAVSEPPAQGTLDISLVPDARYLFS